MRRRAGVACLVVGIAAVVFTALAPSAGAVAPEKVGWWFQLQSGPLALPVPVPTVPEGGLFVQQGPAGPLAYGAVRYSAAAGTSATLTLTTAPGSVAVAASMQACRAMSPWEATPSGPGAWEARPTFGTPCAPGIAAADGSAVAFNLNASYVTDGALDVVIVPLPAATPFAVAFAPPGDSALQNGGGPVSSSPLPPRPSSPSANTGAAAGGTGARPPSVSPGAPPASSTTASAPSAASAARSTVADNVLNIAGLGDPDRGERALALGGAALIVVGWWLLSTRALPMPRLLVGLTGGETAVVGHTQDARVGGVGRFARARETAARSLR